MTRLLLATTLGVLTACVSPDTYNAEVSRVRSLEWERAQTREELQRLAQRLDDLQKTRERLELEQQSLDTERLQLIADLEDLRVLFGPGGSARVSHL